MEDASKERSLERLFYIKTGSKILNKIQFQKQFSKSNMETVKFLNIQLTHIISKTEILKYPLT